MTTAAGIDTTLCDSSRLLCEETALAKGFDRAEVMRTMAGKPLYRPCGYVTVETVVDDRGGVAVPLLRMS